MLGAAWVLENLHLITEYHSHVTAGAPPSGELLRLIQLLQWSPHDDTGWPCVFIPAAWWHRRGPAQAPSALPQPFYVAYASNRRGTPLQVCVGCGHETHSAATLAVFRLRWERCTGRAMPSESALRSGRCAGGDALPRAPPWPTAVPYEVRRPLLGYALENYGSVIAGGYASFCVSSELPGGGPITAVFERLLCWDADPRGPGLQTAPTAIPPTTLPAEYQRIHAGSYGWADVAASHPHSDEIAAPTADGCSLVAVVWPTGARKTARQEGVTTHFSADAAQTILAAEFEGATVSVGLTSCGHLAVSWNGCELLRSDRALLSRQWCIVGASCKRTPHGIEVSLLAAAAPSQWSADLQPGHELCTVQHSGRACKLGTLRGVSIGALRRHGVVEAHYNGKIAGPSVYGTACDLVRPDRSLYPL